MAVSQLMMMRSPAFQPGGLVIELKPLPFDEVAAFRDRRLLILRGKNYGSLCAFELIKNLARLTLGMQHVAGATQMKAPWANRDLMFCFSNGWQIEMRPAFLLEQMSDQVVHMQPLHDHDDGVVILVIETADQSVGIPLLEVVARQLRIGVLRL